MSRLPAWCAVLAAFPLLTASAQEPSVSPTSTEQRPTFRTETATVVVDVVVRDRERLPIRGLRGDDFAVYENGVRQTVTSFAAVEDGSAQLELRTAPEPQAGARAPSLSVITPATVAIVFEQLGMDSARLAQQAAGTFITDVVRSGDYVGVFYLDRAIQVLSPYTQDAARLRRAVSAAARRPGYPVQHSGRVPGADAASPAAGRPSVTTEHDSPFIRAHGTIDGLERLLASMQSLPGRKAVLLFSEGLQLTGWVEDSRRERFLKLLDGASKARVAFYTFDAKGLRIESPNSYGACFGCAPYVGLQMLAAETGGAFVENTNDLRRGVRAVATGLRDYYLLGYRPTASGGGYRHIDVKVERPGVRVTARRGYEADTQPRSGGDRRR